MNVFINEKGSETYYNLFDVSSIKISSREFAGDEYVIDIDVYNKTLHVYVGCYCKEKSLIKRCSELEYNIKTESDLNLVGDYVTEEKVTEEKE